MQALLPAYTFDSLLGAGGMGAVYRAVQTSLDRTVAIKVLPGDLLDDDEANFVERFKNEARTMARMNHPNIVNVFDFGETSTGLLYFVMEFVDGTDVAQMIAAQGRLPEDYALAITAHVCDALAYAHARGVVHRDIKPANILVNREGEIKVADFGLAKQHDGGGGLTKSNMAMGTPDFVAPEALVSGMDVDGRADLYAVGVMLYNMLTGEIPRGRWLMPGEKHGSDPRFDDIIARAMESDRDERYQSATEIRSALDQILTSPLPREKGDTALPTTRPPATLPRKKSLALLLVVIGILITAIGGFSLWKHQTPDPEPAAVLIAPAPVAATPEPKPVVETTPAPISVRAANPLPAPPLVTTSEPKPAEAVAIAAVVKSPEDAPAPPQPKPTSAASPAEATSDAPWTNSLGIPFVPVPGTRVLMAVHETRRQDYAAYAAESEGIDESWKQPRFAGKELPIEENHPVTMISRDDAAAFARWLSAKEDRAYRLPSTREWLLAVGQDIAEPEQKTEADLLSLLDRQFPWGDRKPGEAGNYQGGDDPYELTAPVGSFQANPNGFHDLGGNVWEITTTVDGQAAILGCDYGNYGPFRKSTTIKFRPSDLRIPTSNTEAYVAGFRLALALDETPEKPAPPDQVTQRLNELEKTYLDAFDQQIDTGHRAAVSELNTKYLAAIDRSLATASAGGQLDEALAMRGEKEAIEKSGAVPDADNETTPASLKKLRQTWRDQMAGLLAKRAESAKPLNAAYDRALGAYQEELTRAQNLDGALRVKAVREHLGSSGNAAPTPPLATAPVSAPAPLSAADILPAPPPASQEEIRKLCEWILQKGGTIGLAEEGGTTNYEKGAALPKGKLTPVRLSVYELSFKGEPSEREWFTLIGRVPSLEEIGFTKNPGQVPIEEMRGLVNLRILSLPAENLDDAAFAHLSGLRKLETLRIGGYGIRQFTGVGLGYLPPGLVEFSSNSPTLSAEGIAQLARFKKLRKLVLSGDNFANTPAPVTDAMLGILSSLPDLEELELVEQSVDGSFLTALPANSKLKSLNLFGVKTFKAEHYRQLARLRDLDRLDLPTTDPGPEGMATIATLGKLNELAIGKSTTFTGESFAGIKGFKALEHLYLGDVPTNDAGLDAISLALPGLKDLSLGNAPEYQVTFTPEGFARAMPRFKELTTLKINGNRTTDAYLPAIAQLEKIDYLMLTYAQISDEGLRPLMKLPLGYLRLDGTPVTDAVIPILQECPTLHNVPVGETKMTPAGKAKLADWLRR